jgi:hypothetical protein
MGIVPTTDCHSPDLEVWLNNPSVLLEVIRQQLLHAQRCMKFQADKNVSK